MIAVPRFSTDNWASVVDSRNSSGLRQSFLTDGWRLGQQSSSCTIKIVHGGSFKLCLNRPITPLVSFASKKGSQSHKSSDLDKEDLLTEADLPAKPLGFGEGKVYDTSLEDRLLEEIECEKATNSVAVQKKKTDAALTNNIKRTPASKDSEVGSSATVWIGDLPKKKNIDRDLRTVFRHIPGLLDVSPVVQGNEKTRDPICKGYGFLKFSSIEHAKRFISLFQNQTLTFGKVEKQVSFRLLKASDAEGIVSEQNSSSENSRLRIRDKDGERVVSSDVNTELTFLRTVAQNVSPEVIQQNVSSENYQPQVEVMDDGEKASSGDFSQEMPLGDEDSDDEFDDDDNTEFDISVEIFDVSDNDAPRSEVRRAENIAVREAERRIEEVEARIKQKMEEEWYQSKSDRPKASKRKAGGFNSKRTGAAKQSFLKGNNVAAVTHGLKGREREIMTGVLDKYGKRPIITRTAGFPKSARNTVHQEAGKPTDDFLGV